MADVVSVTGFILSSMPVGDYDRRVVILSRELGKIAAFAKGARRPNSHLIGVTRPFIFGTFEVYRGRDSYTIQKANVTNYFEELVSDLDGVLYGYYFAELAEYYGRENLDAADMINLLYVAFKALVNKSLPNELVRYIYEIRLIAVNGECPDFFSCAGCGSENRAIYQKMLSTMQLKMSREILKHRLQNLKKFLRTQKLFRITIQIRTLSRWKALLSFTM